MPDHDVVRVLIVDDQAPFRDAARAVMSRLSDFEVIGEAESGEEGVALTEQLEPDVIVMDINMGELDGIEATRRITQAHPSAFVVLVSTYELDDLPPPARSCGAAAYIGKDDFGIRSLRQVWEAGGQDGFTRPPAPCR